MHLAKLAIAAAFVLSACDSGGGAGSTFDAGSPFEAGPTFDGTLGGGASSGGGSSSSGGGVIISNCMGCIDKGGRCQPGTADGKCGLSGGTCVDCTGMSAAPFCGAAGECVAGFLRGRGCECRCGPCRGRFGRGLRE